MMERILNTDDLRKIAAEHDDTYGNGLGSDRSPMQAGSRARLTHQLAKGKNPLASMIAMALLSKTSSKTATVTCASFAFELDRLLEVEKLATSIPKAKGLKRFGELLKGDRVGKLEGAAEGHLKNRAEAAHKATGLSLDHMKKERDSAGRQWWKHHRLAGGAEREAVHEKGRVTGARLGTAAAGGVLVAGGAAAVHKKDEK